ncbi:MAG TPA: elongation factor P [Candidatus Paceibacterota bacterium]|nr:elongation factor P [Candidatus Paceibacterota bacterium]
MLSYTELKKGIIFSMDSQPYEVLESNFLRMQQRKAVVQAKIRNLATGKVLDRNFQPSDKLEEIELEKKSAVFIYQRSLPDGRQEFWFHEEGNPKNRFSLPVEIVGTAANFLKPNTVINSVSFNDKVIKVTMPIKMDLKVTEAPPSIKGNTAQGGTKVVALETGAKISVPLFINTDDIIRVNTDTGEYVERVEKG